MTTLDESLQSVSPNVRRAIEKVADRAGTYDADWQVLNAAGEIIATLWADATALHGGRDRLQSEIIGLRHRVNAMDAVLKKVLATVASDGLNQCPIEEPSPDAPWLPVGLIAEIEVVVSPP